MSDYTPDFIHIYSGWHHYIPAAIALVLLILIGVLAIFRRRAFPWMRPSAVLFILGVAILGTAYLSIKGLASSMWSTHAIDFIKTKIPQEDLRENVQNRSALTLPKECKVEAAVMMGWREYARWYCIQGGSRALITQFLDGEYRAHKGDSPLRDPIPEPINDWMVKSEFQPDHMYSRTTGNSVETIAVDSNRDLVVIVSTDF